MLFTRFTDKWLADDGKGRAEKTNKRGKCATVLLQSSELCGSRGGRPGLPIPNSSYGICGRKATLNSNLYPSELRSCEKVEVDVLGCLSLIVRTVSVDVKRQWRRRLYPKLSSGAVWRGRWSCRSSRRERSVHVLCARVDLNSCFRGHRPCGFVP